MTTGVWIYWERSLKTYWHLNLGALAGYIYPLTLLLQPHFLLASFQSTLPKLSHPSKHHNFLVMLYHAHLLAGAAAVRSLG